MLASRTSLRWIKAAGRADLQHGRMTSIAAGLDAVLPQHAVMSRFDAGAPSCVLYPAPNRFVEAIGPDDVARALRQRGGRAVGGGAALAVQVNIPFCERPNELCECAQVITKRHAGAARYLRGLHDEMAVAVAALGSRQVVSRIHVGGAAPLFMSDDQLGQLMATLRGAFQVTSAAGISVDADESLFTASRIERLRAAGFNRLILSLEIDAGEDEARERRLVELMGAARASGFSSIAVELPSGSPRHSASSLERSARLVVAMRPDRIRLVRCGAACSRPSVARAAAPPDARPAADAASCMRATIEQLLAAGYVHLGLDEFALSADALSVAWRQGRLHLGLRGFSVHPEGDVLALGVSAAGRIGSIAYRNVDTLGAFYDALADSGLPVARGLALSRDELARKGVITGLICQGRVDFESINLSHLMDMRTHFAREFALLEPLIQAGLVDVDHEAIELTATGRWFAPIVAAVFDRELQRDVQRSRLAGGD